MDAENDNISSKTWFRSVEPVVKAGYMDGAADGQAATFQSSFDVGYKQGLKFGIQIGFKHGTSGEQTQEYTTVRTLQDTRRINCKICINGTMQEKIDNLYNKQEEHNDRFLQMIDRH